MTVELARVPFPEFGIPEARPLISAAEYTHRIDALHALAGTDWVAVYGDREHAANLIWLTDFDPRFEEAMLLVGPRDQRFLVVGSEGLIHAEVTPLDLPLLHYQPFSLMGQPLSSPALADILREAGVGPGDLVGVVGWKYDEAAGPEAPPAYVPAFIPRAIETAAGRAPIDVTAALMDPVRGLRNASSAAQVAQYEWGATRAAAAVWRVVHNTRPGMTELEAASHMGYAGEPLNMHPTVTFGKEAINGLRSPGSRVIEAGDAAIAGVGYWGGLTCRAGLLMDEPEDHFLENVAKPYFGAIAAWWTTVAVGVPGSEVQAAVETALSHASFGLLLNPGHLGSYDEWVHSPIRAGSNQELASGMVFQCDIIPDVLAPGRAINCEDTVALADEVLRAQLAEDFPETWARIEARRAFMADALGIRLRPDVLPLSAAPGYLPPFWLQPDLVCVSL